MLLTTHLVLATMLAPAGADGTRPGRAHVFAVPRLSRISINGDASDWGEQGLRVDTLCAGDVAPRSSDDFSGSFRLAWTDAGLAVLASVTDDVPVESRDQVGLRHFDSITLFMGTPSGDQVAIIVTSGQAPDQPRARFHLESRRNSEHVRDLPMTAQVAATTRAQGYVAEALLPWSNLAIRPRLGERLTFQIAIRDYDTPDRVGAYRWFPLAGTRIDPSRAHTLRLARRADAPARIAASAWYDDLRRVLVRVIAPSGSLGKRVTVADGERDLASARLRRAGGRAEALVVLPMPAWGQPYGPLTATVDSDSRAFALLPEADPLRRRALRDAEIAAKPFVFSGAKLPTCDFTQPTRVEQLAGRYTLETTYYNREHVPVTSADSPGRYGAIVRATTEHGGDLTRYITLYRLNGELPGASLFRPPRPWPLAPQLPDALGTPVDVLSGQSALVDGGLTNLIVDSFRNDPASAIVLAGLSETPADAVGASVWTTDERWWHVMKTKAGDTKPLRYLLFLPDGYEDDTNEKWPLMLFLHGAGERGENLDRVKIHGPPKLISSGHDLPFIVVAPQCPSNTWWSVWLLREVLDEVIKTHRVDESRVYLTGLSMGGFGTWKMAAEFPGLFAAAVPICGGGDPATAPAIGGLPVWAFHGAKDDVVPLSHSEEMVEAMRAAGHGAELTVYPEATHDSWTQTYDNPELYAWLLKHRRP